MTSNTELSAPKDWKQYLARILLAALFFSVLTFIYAELVMHLYKHHYLISLGISSIVYAGCLVYTMVRLLKQLPLAVLMLLIPIAPLFILIYVVSLLTYLFR